MSTTKIKSKTGLLSLFGGEKVVMRTKLIAIAMITGVFLANSASADGVIRNKRPLITASITVTKQPTLVQTAPAPRKPL
jgi:beta-lactamase class A